MDNKEYDRKIRTVTSSIILKSIIFFIFVIFFIFYVDLKTVNENKSNLKLKIDEYKEISKNGLKYDDYLTKINDPKTTEIVSSIGSDYFSKNLVNTTSANYDLFLKEKEKYISDLKNTNTIELREQKISNILPSYTKGAYIEGNLNDLGFINYLEVLLRTFGLRTTSTLGVGELVIYENSKQEYKKSFGSDIFYMPITLSLEGRKSDMLDFIHFVQNVGNIQNIKNNDFSLYSDKIINKVIIGQETRSNYNIYENKFMDISEISFSQYIDSSSDIRTEGQKSTNGFMFFLKNGIQKDEIVNINASFRFYMKGIPEYKVLSFLDDLDKKHKDLKLKIKSIISESQNKNNSSLDNLISLKSLELYLNDISEKIKAISLGSGNEQKTEDIYKKASDIMYDLNNISSRLEILLKK